jgi:hypothetical protein
MPDFGFAFARPAALWLLAALPLFALLGLLLGVRRRRLPRLALWLRLATVALLVVGLAGPLLTTGADAASTVLVVDRSRSLGDDAPRLSTGLKATLSHVEGSLGPQALPLSGPLRLRR